MKKSVFIFTAILLMASTNTFSQRKQIGTSNTFWELVINSNDTTLKISGSGDIPNFTYNNKAPWYSIRTTLKHLEIGDSITRIGNYVFSDCRKLTGNLNIPSSVTSIGSNAFLNCKGLMGELIIPSGVTFIGSGAFSNCEGVTGNLIIPSGITSIEGSSFDYCTGLTSLTLPATVTSIKSSAFRECSGLTTLSLPSMLISIENRAFYRCVNLKGNIDIPSKVNHIGNEAFGYCEKITSLTFPASLDTIAYRAFIFCTGLKEIRNLNPIPTPNIDDKAFDYVKVSACTLKVPAASVELYKAALVWKFFFVEDMDVSIKEMEEQKNEFIIYPNPTNGELKIQHEGLKIISPVHIFDMYGKMIFETNQTSFSIQHFSSGIYFVQIKTDKGKIVRKIVKQ